MIRSKKISMNLFTRLRNESSVHHRSKNLFSSSSFFHKEKTWFSSRICRSLASPPRTSDFNRTLCYYRIVRTLYYPFPTQPCIESQKVTRFHVAQLCRPLLPPETQCVSIFQIREIYISSPPSVNIIHLTQFYAVFDASWKRICTYIYVCVCEDYTLRRSGTLHWLFAHGISFKGEIKAS